MAQGKKAKSGDQWKRFALGAGQTSQVVFRRDRSSDRLCLMFINKLEEGVQSRVLKFADDTKLYSEVTKEEGGEQLQEDLDKCTEWAKQWMRELNVAMCKVRTY